MGMLATVMNGLALEAAIERKGAQARNLSALSVPTQTDPLPQLVDQRDTGNPLGAQLGQGL